jgi:hypothetical protein
MNFIFKKYKLNLFLTKIAFPDLNIDSLRKKTVSAVNNEQAEAML